jgi:phosphoserine phosphatase
MENRPLTTRVILVRHGESTYNLESRVQGHCDESHLTPKGIADAQRVGQALAGLNFDAIYTSPLHRAWETTQEILSVLQTTATAPVPEPQVRDRLKEIHLPLWEGMLFEEVRQRFPEGYQKWRQRPHELEMEIAGPDGITLFCPVPALFEQAQQFWNEVLPHHGGETILVVAHSGINRALIGTAIGLVPACYPTLQQANCGVSVLNFPGQRGEPAQLESLNITSHLGSLPRPRTGYGGLRLLLVRHGETEWNRQGRFQGQIDVPLNENGRQQGRQVAEFLKEMPIDFAVSSSMSRPRETAELTLTHHPQVALSLEDGFREISHGTWEGQFEPDIERDYPGELERWRQTPAAVQMPAGENLQQVWERAIATWNAVVAAAKADPAKPKTVLVVAHDAINKVILCYIAGAGPEQFWSFKQGNGAISVIDYPEDDGAPILQAMNITTHLAGGVLDQTAAGAL